MKKTIGLENLDCANCAAKLEAKIAKLPDVDSVSVNFMGQKFILEAADEKFDAVLDAAKVVIHKFEPDIVVKA